MERSPLVNACVQDVTPRARPAPLALPPSSAAIDGWVVIAVAVGAAVFAGVGALVSVVLR